MLAVYEELNQMRGDLQGLGVSIKTTKVEGQIQRILAIMSTAGDREKNKQLIESLSELNLELSDEFPHVETIEYLFHRVMKCFYDAVGAHYQNWEEIRQTSILKALGAHQILDEPKLFRPSFFRKNKEKKKLRIRYEEPEIEESEEEEYDEDDGFYEN